MNQENDLIDKLDAILPQTQCQLCEYPDCRAYATAIAQGATSIERCHPGGLPVLHALADACAEDATPFITTVQQQFKQYHTVEIREHECIGCTKCIQACPVDAIIGSGKLMHTVLSDVCNGCDLCLPVCPVDCIDLKEQPQPSSNEQAAQANNWRQRYQNKQARQLKLKQQAKAQHQQQKNQKSSTQATIASRQAAIAAALARVKNKKGNS